MEQILPLQFVKQMKCTKHKMQPLDQIDLTGRSTGGRICLFCIKQKKIPYEQYLSLTELFQQKEFLTFYPSFKSPMMWEQIRKYFQESLQFSNIDQFFLKFRQDIEQIIQEAENHAKKLQIQNESSKQILLKELDKIGEMSKLQELLVSGSENINEFLSEKWKNSEKNEKMIQSVFDEIKSNCSILNFQKKQKEVKCLIESLQKFSLFEPIIQKNQVNMIKSTYLNSGNMTINKTDSNCLQLINKLQYNTIGQAFLDFILLPSKRYTIKLNFQPKGQNLSDFYFGLVPNEIKDQECCYKSRMCYSSQSEMSGISRQVKGSNMTNQQRKNQKQEFEVRVFLNEKILRVASLPNYESILELDNINKIQVETKYRFFVYIYYIEDMIEITDVKESDYYFENDKIW